MRRQLFTLLILLLYMQYTLAQETYPLYESAVPANKTGAADTEKTEIGDDRVTRVHAVLTPTITVFKPKVQDPRGISVIIFPGGGYAILSIDKEGYEIAHVLNEMGITAFIIKYRIPADERNLRKSFVPLMDAQRAIQLVRKNARQWGVDPSKVGVMGFSAGGHLAATASTLFDKAVIENPQKISLRPDFTVLAYPVITLDDNFTHKGSRENLLGKNFTEEEKRMFSAEKNVKDNTPPAFIFHAQDDGAVPVENSLMYYNALLRHGIKNNLLVIYPQGGHGFGLNLPGNNEKWTERLKNWLDFLYK